VRLFVWREPRQRLDFPRKSLGVFTVVVAGFLVVCPAFVRCVSAVISRQGKWADDEIPARPIGRNQTSATNRALLRAADAVRDIARVVLRTSAIKQASF